MPQLDASSYLSQIFWLILSFGLLYLVLWRVALPRVSETIDARQRTIDEDLRVASQFHRRVQSSIQKRHAQRDETQRKAEFLVRQVVEKAQQEADSGIHAVCKEEQDRTKQQTAQTKKELETFFRTAADAPADILVADTARRIVACLQDKSGT